MIVSVLWRFLTVPWVGLQFVVGVHVFPDHTHLLIFYLGGHYFEKKFLDSGFPSLHSYEHEEKQILIPNK